jgi:methyl-accepting chemotaxis protein
MESQHLNTILIVMVAAYGASVLLQMAVLAGVLWGAGKAIKAARQYADEMEARIRPVLASSQELIEKTKGLVTKLEPKLESAAGDLAEITRIAREETSKIGASADEIADRIRRQAERMDSMTTSALDGVEKASHVLNVAVNTPVKQVSGIVAAARAVLNTLRQPSSPRRGRPTDEEIPADRQQYV